LTAALEELYQQLIVDHSRRPRNFRKLEPAERSLEGFNPLCGDRVRVYVNLDGDRIREASFEGCGCAICTASASLMTDSVKGRHLAEVERLFEAFHKLVTGGSPAAETELGKLAAFGAVAAYPARVKCATLPWHTLRAALAGSRQSVSTE